MKKLLCMWTSLALSVLSAQGATLWTTTFGNAAQSDSSLVTLTNTGGEMSSVTGSMDYLRTTDYSNGQTQDLDLMTNGTVCSDASLFTPNVNVQATGSWTAGMTFTNSGSQGCSISSVKMTMISFNSAGDILSYARTFSLTLTLGGEEVTATVEIAANTGKDGTFATLVFDRPLTLGAGESLDFSVLAHRTDQTNGGFFGIKSMEFQGELLAPEPSAVSLGLLGLGALMIRRRIS